MVERTAVDERFYGRTMLLQEIKNGLHAPRPPSYCIVGSNLIGKTRLLSYLASGDGPLLSENLEGPHLAVALLDCNTRDARENLGQAITVRLHKLFKTILTATSQEGASTLQASDLTMSDAVRIAAEGRIRPVLLLDNFDTLAQGSPEAGKTAAELVPLLQEMPVVVTAAQPLYDLPGQLIPFAFVDVLTQRLLGLMESSTGLEWTRAHTRPFDGLATATSTLTKMTGLHPFLLRQLGYTLSEVQELVTSGRLDIDHLPLIRMRLAENGRRLFVSLWRGLQTASSRDELRTRMALLERLAVGPLPAEEMTTDQLPSLNLLINRAVVVYGEGGYQLACPLFADFVNRRIGASARNRSRISSAVSAGEAFTNSLTKTENALLRYFQANRNSVLSNEDLLTHVWHRPDASPRRVQEAIRRLRLRLEEAVPPVGVIENERGRGYRFVPAQP